MASPPASPGRHGGRRPLSPDESALWRRVTAGAKPLKPEPAAPAADGDAAAPPAPSQRRPAHRATAAPAEHHRHDHPGLAPGVAPGVDRRTLVRLRRGLLPPEAAIDLHGCTQEEAFTRLAGFLVASQRSGRRCVLVVTGKGIRSGGEGVLKAAVPRWLNEAANRPRVLAFSHATAAHGGEGALFVLLRRLRA